MWYTKREDIEYLLKIIQGRYPIKADWDQTFYLGVTLELDYDKRKCKMLMPRYVKQALIKFKHKFNKIPHLPSPFKAQIKECKRGFQRYLNMAIWSVMPPLRVSGLLVSFPKYVYPAAFDLATVVTKYAASEWLCNIMLLAQYSTTASGCLAQ